MSLLLSFSMPLGVAVQPGLVTAGRFDGTTRPPLLACATTAGRVFLHSAGQASTSRGGDINYLNINKKVSPAVC